MADLASCGDDEAHNARQLAQQTQLPPPVVGKLLKQLTREGLLNSQRGSKGGYSLARPPHQISLVEMVTALEGPVGITQCAIHPGSCAQEENCHVRDPWQRINQAVANALANITLADLSDSQTPSLLETFVPLINMARNTQGSAETQPTNVRPVERHGDTE